MKISFKSFLDMFYSILLNDEVDCININDIIEIIKIIYTSDEFKVVSARLDINEFTEDNITNHPYTCEIDENGLITFNIPKDKINNIIKENKVDMGYIQQAINKRALVKYLNIKLGNNVQFKYDSPNGMYNVQYAEFPDYKAESSLFTDGKSTSNSLVRSSENNSITRMIKIDDATFSIVAYYIDGQIGKVELRGTYYGDYNILLYEAPRILNNIKDSFKIEIEDSPKVYKLKKH